MTKQLIYILSTILLLQTVYTQNQKCRALVLQGGGDKGAFEAGAIWQLINSLPATDVQYDIFSGVSVGALNTGACVQFAKGEEQQLAEYVLNIWNDINSDNVFKEWPLGIAGAIFFDPSLYNTAPLRAYLDEKFVAVKRNFTIGTVDANNGTFVRFNNKNLFTKDDVVTATMCSSAMPAIFPYINFRNSSYIDGGSVLNLDVGGAVDFCREIVDDDSDIIVDVILCTGAELQKVDASDDKTLESLMRYLQINSYFSALDDLLHAYEDFPKVTFRYVIEPTSPLPSGLIPLNFDQKQIQEMITAGKQDAKDVIGLGEKISHIKILEKAKLRRSQQEAAVL